MALHSCGRYSYGRRRIKKKKTFATPEAQRDVTQGLYSYDLHSYGLYYIGMTYIVMAYIVMPYII